MFCISVLVGLLLYQNDRSMFYSVYLYAYMVSTRSFVYCDVPMDRMFVEAVILSSPFPPSHAASWSKGGSDEIDLNRETEAAKHPNDPWSDTVLPSFHCSGRESRDLSFVLEDSIED